MAKITTRVAILAAAALLATGASGGRVEAQGLLEFLFGAPPQPTYQAPRYDDDDDTFRMRVNPRRERRALKAVEVSRPAKPFEPIDPKANPNWHLIDPTLKPGDIVVLKGRVLVYDGGGLPASQSDFTSFDRSRRLSKSERGQIESIAALPELDSSGRRADAPTTGGSVAAIGGTETVRTAIR